MSINLVYDLIVVGGGAAGIFGAIQAAEANPNLKILVLEKSQNLLSKVKISGGGRCNVTHACFEPAELVAYYPRGQKELLGPFHRFMCGDMLSWLEEHGVKTKIESDGRIFPITNSSQTIIDCFLNLCSQYQIAIRMQEAVLDLVPTNPKWTIVTKSNRYFSCNVLYTTGSSPSSWKVIERLGHTLVTPVPSLFTFNINDPLIQGLQGISFPEVILKMSEDQLSSLGPLLITHWGLSGPAILKMSAWGARDLNQHEYRFTLQVNWVNEPIENIIEKLRQQKNSTPSKLVSSTNIFNLTKRFYLRLIQLSKLEQAKWATLSNHQLNNFAESLGRYQLQVTGKSTYKDEFVTSGGVQLKEINFKTMESKIVPGLFFAGEVLDIDAVTGGYNFQAAWTTAFIAGQSVA